MPYYLVASLPPLSLDEPPTWTAEEFLFHGQGALTPEEWRELALLVEDRAAEGGSGFAAWWHGLDTQIRNVQARIRAHRLNVDAHSFVRMHEGFDVAVEKTITEAMTLPNPLERELAIDRCRWAALDERVLNDPYGLETVLAYALRLRMVERWARLSEETGMERIETFIDEIADESIELQRLGGA